MKKKIMPVLLAIVLILVVIAVAYGRKILDKYTYSKERADLNQYFELTDDSDIAVILGDERIDEKAKYMDGVCYFDLATIEKYFTDRFYINIEEREVLLTTDTDVIKVSIGDDSTVMYISEVGNSLGYKAAVLVDDTVWIAADYIKNFVNMEYHLYENPLHMQVYTQWNIITTAELKKKTSVRYRGGIKSEILTDLAEGDKVTILEEMETWTKVKTQDAFIGYVENKVLKNTEAEQQTPVEDAMKMEFHSIQKSGKINMAFHQVFAEVGGGELKEAVRRTKAVNVVAPTFFRLKNSEGDIASVANASYVNAAHELGMEVWAVITDVDTSSLYGEELDFVNLFSHRANRAKLIQGLMEQVEAYGIDGINIDIEQVKRDAGIHFVQFLRELSIETRKQGVVLSVDNFVPTEYTAHYNRKEQGLVVDYVVIMGYDEYYNGCGEAGPNASINFVEQGIENTKKVVPQEKIINAIPFYTRVWESGTDGVKSQNLVMSSQAEWVKKIGVEPTWLDEYCQNYVEYKSNSKTVQCWLEDTKSIEVKLQVMKAQQIAGVAEWKLGIETSDVWDVIAEYMNQ